MDIDITVIWFIIIVFATLMYIVMDGFDLGIGMLFSIVHAPGERDVMVNSVAPGGVLIYETFAHGNASVGRPSRPDFLLQPGELLTICQPTLRILAYEDGFLQQPERFVQRIVAVRERPCPPEAPARHFLSPAADPASLTAG